MKLKSQWYNVWIYRAEWGRWIASAGLMWLFLAVVVGACVAGSWLRFYFGFNATTSIAVSGWLLEIAGIWAVAKGFANKIDLYGDDGVGQRIIRWLKACPFLSQDSVVCAGTAHLKLSGGKVRADLRGRMSPDADIEMRVSYLELALEALKDNFVELADSTESSIVDLGKELERKFADVSKQVEELHKKSLKAHVGDIGLEFVGLGWVVLGLTFATIPEGVLWLFGDLIEFFTWIYI